MRPSQDPRSGQILEFLNVTAQASPGSKGNKNEGTRRIVRTHAIRDANRRKKLGLGKTEISEAPPKPQSTFTAKFRLPKEGKTKKKSSISPLNENVEKSLEASSTNLRHYDRSNDNIFMSKSFAFDPFDSLPARLKPRMRHGISEWGQQTLFRACHKERLFLSSAVDPAWFNATLSLISLNFDLKSGASISAECLFYRGEALRIVNQRLRESGGDVSDHTVAAIASLANFDTTNGLRDSAKMHLEGLVNILTHKGDLQRGLLSLHYNDTLQKIVAWSDLSYSTAFDLPPRFPALRTTNCQATLPEFLDYFLPYFSSFSVSLDAISSPHDLVGEMSYVFRVLRLLSICTTQTTPSAISQSLYTRGLYIVEYRLLVVLDSTSADDYAPSRDSQIYGSARLAAYLYMYLFLREIAPAAGIVKSLVRRLRTVLGPVGALLGVWRDDLELLLWIVSMGGMYAETHSERAFFVGVLRMVCGELGIESEEGFTETVKEVLWMDWKCWRDGCLALWREMSTGDGGWLESWQKGCSKE